MKDFYFEIMDMVVEKRDEVFKNSQNRFMTTQETDDWENLDKLADLLYALKQGNNLV